MFRKKAFEQAGGYRQEYYKAEDYDLWRRIIENWNVGQIPEILYWYRINPNGISQNNSQDQKVLTEKIITQQYHTNIRYKSPVEIYKDFQSYKNSNNYYSSQIAQMYKDQQINLSFNFYVYGYIKEGFKNMIGSFFIQPKRTVKNLWRIALWSPFKKILGRNLWKYYMQ